MNKCLLAFVLLLAFASCEKIHTIFRAYDGHCDKDGGGFLEVDFRSKELITSKIQFDILLKSKTTDEVINATCWAEGKGVESTFVSDMLDTAQESLMSDSEGARLRNLQEEDVYYAGCHFTSPEDSGEFEVAVPDDSEFEVPNPLPVYLVHCLSADQARGRMKIALSWRQVNSFDLKAFTFMFYAFTSANIKVTDTIIFKLWVLKGKRRLKKIEATCALDGSDITVSAESPIAPAAFKCSFADQVEGLDLDDIEIASSDGVAGFPLDPELLSPKWIDYLIKIGKLKNALYMTNIPIFPKVTADDIKFADDFSFFTWKIQFTQTDLDIKVGDFFKFPLTFPTGIKMKAIIEALADGYMTLRFEIQGEIDDSPLIWEQTVISFNGIEVMVLPSFETISITTKGCPEDNEPLISDEPMVQFSDLSDIPAFENKPMTLEEALRRAEIPLSFRQINDIKKSGEEITFNFHALSTKDLTVGGNYSSIILIIQLVGEDGVEDETHEASCTLQQDVTLGSDKLVQANYLCKVEDTGNYDSLRLNSSDDVAGLPSDEALRNPNITDLAIADNELKDCAKDSSVPPVFTVESIDNSTAETEGIFIINGTFDKEPNVADKLEFPLTYPEGVTLQCTVEEGKLKCKPDAKVNDTIVMEQTIMSKGADELFILGSFSQANLSCENGVLKDAEKKVKVEISFRQVSHVEAIDHGIKFFFAAWVNSGLKAGETINMKVLLDEGAKKVEKNASCVLKADVPSSQDAVQGDFDCTVQLDDGEEVPPQNLTVSTTDNDEIGGCDELSDEEASPTKTDAAIEESKSLNNSLAITYDLSIEENKNNGNITPPTFNIEQIDTELCAEKGKMIVTGTFDKDITEELTFEIPLSFPMSDIKCTVESATANTKVDLTCKIQKVKRFARFKRFVFEPRMIKNKKKAVVFVKGSVLEGEEEEYMEYSYNEIREMQIKKKKNAKVSFLQLGPPQPGFLFFMALMKLPGFIAFPSPTITYQVSFITEGRRLRALAEEEKDGQLECSVNDTSANTNVALLNCKDKAGTVSSVKKMDLADPNIGGTPEAAKIETNPAYDYSKNLNVDVPQVNITSIEKGTCSTTGQYIIKGTASTSLAEGSKITIPFSSPDSSGLCHVSSGTSVVMTCENTQRFDAPKAMIILPQMIYAEDDTTPYFQITNTYTKPITFSCVISDKSLKNDVGNIGSSGSGSDQIYSKKSSSGLSGGAIAGIVIGCVAAVAIIGAVIALLSKRFSSKKEDISAVGDNSSTLNKFSLNNQNANIV